MISRLLPLLALALMSNAASAGTVLDRVKADNVVRCGAVERPGVASVGDKGQWEGLTVDVCRAVAAAVLGSPDKVSFSEYETPAQFDRVAKGEDDVFFLTGTEIHHNNLAGKVVPGPAVFYQTHAVLVPKDSKAQKISDLAGDKICVMIASPVERSLSHYFDRLGKTWTPIAFSEDGEMVDAYKVQHCHAVAYELTSLPEIPADPGINDLHSRILPESLATFPVMAATGTRDAEWSAIVAWTVDTLISGERPETRWYAGAAGAMPVEAPELGLDAGWQKRVLTAVGNIGDIYERHLGNASEMRLARGPNANQTSGGLLAAPFLE